MTRILTDYICPKTSRALVGRKACTAMIGESRQLVTDAPSDFEKEPVEVQDWRKCTDHFRGILRIYPSLIKKIRKTSTCSLLDLQKLGSQLLMPKNLPNHWWTVDISSAGRDGRREGEGERERESSTAMAGKNRDYEAKKLSWIAPKLMLWNIEK